MPGDGFGLIGCTLDTKYRVEDLVGEGGFGLVYRGFHLIFEHPVGIKCLLIPGHFDDVAQQLFLDRFKEEGKLLSKLSQHPNITRVFDFGETWTEKGIAVPYLVLEWLTGSDLEQLLRARLADGLGPYTEQQAVSLLRPVVDAIAFAHRAGVAHRDLKPANILLTETLQGPALKVLDFGVAKAMQEGENTAAKAHKTTGLFHPYSPAYGAPEQFRASVFGATGPWTDVHALGLLFVELVTGKPAYEGIEHADFYEAAVSPTRPTPRTRGAHVSDEFEAVVAKALARDSQQRYQDASELLAALQELVPAGATPPPLFPSQHDLTRGVAPVPRAPVADPEAATVIQVAPRTPLSIANQSAPPHRSRGIRAVLVAGLGVAVLGGLTGWWFLFHKSADGQEAAVGLSLPIPEGSFAMGSDDGAPDQRPVHTVHVAAFELDKTEVTARAYALCVSAGACAGVTTIHMKDTPEREDALWNAFCNAGKPDRLQYPMNCVDVIQAEAYCKWAGKRLPTEEEWEYAARGGEQARNFPWGADKPGPALLNACGTECTTMAAGNGWKWTALDDADDGNPATSPVGSYPSGAGRWGQLDLAGNVWEWTSSPFCPYGQDAKKCLTTTRVARGGSWSSRYPGIFRTAFRTRFVLEYRSESLGFRCAKSR